MNFITQLIFYISKISVLTKKSLSGLKQFFSNDYNLEFLDPAYWFLDILDSFATSVFYSRMNIVSLNQAKLSFSTF